MRLGRISQYRRGRIPFAIQIFLMGCLPVVPCLILIVYERGAAPIDDNLLWLIGFLYLLFLGVLAAELWGRCHGPLHALANMVSSLQQGDYTQRVSGPSGGDSLGALGDEINALADVLQNNRYAAVESVRRFQYLIDQLDLGVLAFDESRRLSMVNGYAANLLGEAATNLLGRTVDALAMNALWEASNGRMVWLRFPGKTSRYLVNVSRFRLEGRQQKLYLLSDVNNPLRDEERLVWKRLIRVIGHELNNSLTPIISLAQTLRVRVAKSELSDDRKLSTLEALDTISQRAKGLNRFVEDYAILAKMPEPVRKPVGLEGSLRRVVQLLNCRAIHLEPGPTCDIEVDTDQVEQMWINLLRNACEAVADLGDDARVVIGWFREGSDAVVTIDDNGPGIGKGEDLFVPFYSTKPGGSGIGLVISQQMVEVNGGSLELMNRRPETGCRAVVRLPVA